MTPLPLVSCIMPTFDRRPFARRAIDYFLRQDYMRKQLIVIDDGADSVEDLIPKNDSVIYFRLHKRIVLGEKRNIAIENSTGDIILHWDDDDWYAANRISYQVNALLKEEAALCGLGAGLYYDMIKDQFWQCQERLHNTLFYAEIIGGSLCYPKSLWQRSGKFHPHCKLAEDSLFLRKLPKGLRLLKLSNQGTLVYIRHATNTWRFECGEFVNPSEWIRLHEQSIMPQEDLNYYHDLRKHLT
jgi:glycosyltransferase involved in cell wall biosynthesis